MTYKFLCRLFKSSRLLKASALLTLLTSTSLSGRALAATQAEKTLNNKAEIELEQKRPANAVKVLISLLRKNPAYCCGRGNLTIAYQKLAKANDAQPLVALDYLWRAMCLDQDDKNSLAQLREIYKRLGKNYDSADEHVSMAEDCLKRNCLYGAWVEFQESLWLKPAPTIIAKMKQLRDQILATSTEKDENWLASIAVKPLPMLPQSEDEESEGELSDKDYAQYMSNLQHIIKSKWHPQITQKNSKTCSVRFFAHRDGTISGARLSRVSGDRLYDADCLAVILGLEDALALPKGSPSKVEIDFKFDYNFYRAGTIDVGELRRAERLAKLKNLENDLSALEKQGLSSRRYMPIKLLAIGKLQTELGNYVQSVETYRRCLTILQAIPLPGKELFEAYEGMADAEQLSGKLTEAEASLQSAITIAETEKVPDIQISSLLELYGKVLYKANKVSQAEVIYNRVRAVKKAQT